MNAERWECVKEVFDLAIDAPVEQQLSIIQRSCNGDAELEAEVLRLLHSDLSAGEFLETAAGDLHAYLEPGSLFTGFSEGTVLARRFEVRRFINAGGMGEVYEAWDRELNQAVAIKTILPHIAVRTDVIERFKQEVRLTREISHTNICRVHELFLHEEADGSQIWFLSMELLRGLTLLERARVDGGLPPDVGVLVASQLLSGIEAAHARGVTHRDFKSGNVILIETYGEPIRAVITDFGLSIRVRAGEADADVPAGMGTPGYMAPEQEQQGSVGPLADQYALGVVLYEMMTGSLPQPSPVGANLRGRAAKRGYPVRWDGVIQRCMQRDPASRFKDIAAVRRALMLSRWRQHPRWLAVAALLIVGLGVALLFKVARERRGAEPCLICDVRQLTSDTDESESPSLSLDGKYVAYSSDQAESGNLDIFVQALPSGLMRRITHDRLRDGDPSLSPDGSTVAFRSERAGGGIYVATTRDPGEPRLLAVRGRNPRISPDGRRLLYWTGDLDQSNLSGKMYMMSLTGGKPERLAPGFVDVRFPVWSLDGASILFEGCYRASQSPHGCFDWWTMKLADGVPHATGAFATLQTAKLLPGRLNSVVWTPDGLVYSAIGESHRPNLVSLRLDPQTMQATGSPTPLLQETAGGLDPSISASRDVAFTRTSGALHIWRILPAPRGQKRELEKMTQDADVDASPFAAEGGRAVVYSRGRKRERQIFLLNTQTGEETAVVNAGTHVQSPILDESGSWLAYQQVENDGSSAIYAGQVGGTMKQVCGNCMDPMGWFQHDRAFFFRDGTHGTVNMMNPRDDSQKIILQEAGRSIGDVSWSSQNGLLLFIESREDRKRMYIVRLNPQTGDVESSWIPVPVGDGVPWHPRWSGDGKTIFYVSNADGFSCVYGLSFNASTKKFGTPFDVAHFHNQRASIDNVLPQVFNLSTTGDTIYLNLGEQSSTIQLGKLANRP